MGLAKVQEDGASQPGDRRRVVVAEFHDNVVEAVIPPHCLVAVGKWQLDRLIIGRVRRIVTPAQIFMDRDKRKLGVRRVQPVRPEIDPAQGPVTDGRCHIALAFPACRDQARLADKAWAFVPGRRKHIPVCRCCDGPFIHFRPSSSSWRALFCLSGRLWRRAD